MGGAARPQGFAVAQEVISGGGTLRVPSVVLEPELLGGWEVASQDPVSGALMGQAEPLRRAPEQPSPWQAMEHRIREEQRAMDQKIILELDRKVADQQSTLEKAGVAGFYVTTNPQVSVLGLCGHSPGDANPQRPGSTWGLGLVSWVQWGQVWGERA